MSKPLSPVLEEIEPTGPVDKTLGLVDRASYDKLKAIAIELAKACEAMIGGSVCHSSETTCGEAIARAKDILGGG